MEEYLETLGITREGYYSGDAYIIDIRENEYGRLFSMLDRQDDLSFVEDNQILNEDEFYYMWESLSQPYTISLIGNFKSKIYQIIVVGEVI